MYRGYSPEVGSSRPAPLRSGADHLFTAYVKKAGSTALVGKPGTEYTREQTLHWLAWLARALIRSNQSTLYLELMQPDWLPSRAQLRIAKIGAIASGVLVALGTSLIERFIDLVVTLIQGKLSLISSPLRLSYSLNELLFNGSAGMAFIVLVAYKNNYSIKPTQNLRWSWAAARRGLISKLVRGWSSD